MKLSTVFTVNAILALLFGLGLALMPTTMAALYGADLGAAGLFLGRLLGAAFIAIGLICWMAKDASGDQRPLVFSFFVEHLIGLVFAVMAQLNGVVNSLGWSIVVIYLYLTLGYAYHQFIKS